MRPMRDLVLVKSFVEGGHHVDNINHVEVDHGKGSGKNGLIRFFTFLLKHYKNCTVAFFNEKCLWQLFLANWLLPVFDALSVSRLPTTVIPFPFFTANQFSAIKAKMTCILLGFARYLIIRKSVVIDQVVESST